MPNRLVIASGNPGKVLEIKAILAGLEVAILSAKECGVILNVPENGQSYAENAKLKALAYQEATGEVVLADDSGLEVDALQGAPGIHSARYAPQPHASDADRRAYLLEQLAGKPQPWPAHFHCTAILATPEGQIYESEGICEGQIITTERGAGGFGYDPIFFLPGRQVTMAEIPASLKNQISHRARAVRALLPVLHKVFHYP